MAGKPTTIDEYLARVTPEQRAALEKLRRDIRSAALQAEECIRYGIAAFRHKRMLVGFGAAAGHCSFHLMSSKTVAAHRDALRAYDTGTGTIRFPADKPLPTALVRKLVKARLAENEEDEAVRRHRPGRRAGRSSRHG